MPRKPRFTPPLPTAPPSLVSIEWIDAQAEMDYDGLAEDAGGLVLLPTAGFHVRNGKSPEGILFVVIAREYSISAGKLYHGSTLARDIISIPAGWIRRWTVASSFEVLYPKEPI